MLLVYSYMLTYLHASSTYVHMYSQITLLVGLSFDEINYVEGTVLDQIPLSPLKIDTYNPSPVIKTFIEEFKANRTSMFNRQKAEYRISFDSRFNAHSKALMIMMDNNDLNDNKTDNFHLETYYSPALAINFAYAQKHDYDLLVLKVNATNLISDVIKRYNMTMEDVLRQQSLKEHDNGRQWSYRKDDVSVFNSHLKELRAAPWSKLPALALIADALSTEKKMNVSSYDLIWYMDSDFVVNPILHDNSLYDVLTQIDSRDSHGVTSGVSLAQTSMIFFSNAPYASVPCSGSIIFVPSPKPLSSSSSSSLSSPSLSFQLVRDLLVDWWDHDIPAKNFHHEYEQASLWDLLGANHRIVDHYSYIHSMKQFPPCEGQIFCHIGHPWRKERMKILAEFLDELGIDDDAFRAIISFLQSTSRIVLPSLEMTDYVNNIGKNTSAEAPVFMEKWRAWRSPCKSNTTTNSSLQLPLMKKLLNSAFEMKTQHHFEVLLDGQFPAGMDGCKSKDAVLVKSLQQTGLGAVMKQLAYILFYAHSVNAVLILDSSIKSPYFTICPSMTWNCTFLPITNCTSAEVNKIVYTYETTANADNMNAQNKLTKMPSVEDLEEIVAFLSRPSVLALSLASQVKSKLEKQYNRKYPDATDIVTIHIRQTKPLSSRDVVRHIEYLQNYIVWNSTMVLELCSQISRKLNNSNFLIISDDSKLMLNIENDTSKNTYPFHIITTENVIKHPGNENDCLRELGCDGISASDAAAATVIDLILASRTIGIAGTFRSQYTKLIKSMNLWYLARTLHENDVFDLDSSDELCINFNGTYDLFNENREEQHKNKERERLHSCKLFLNYKG